MKQSNQQAFTLVEIMIVVAIIALLAAIAIPNVLRSRTNANEGAAIENLSALAESVGMYDTVFNAYPDDWDADMYGAGAAPGAACVVGVQPDPDFGPPQFCLDLEGAAANVQGFNYAYAEGPAGCNNTAGKLCVQYTLTVRPTTVGRTGTRSFFANERGVITHCLETTSGALGTAVTANMLDDSTLDLPPANCD